MSRNEYRRRPYCIAGLMLAVAGALALTACEPKLRSAQFRCDPTDPDSCPRGWSCQRLGTGVHHLCYREFNAAFCGNGVIDPDEECDGDALSVETCRELGYWSGQLDCDDRCRLVEEGCRTMDRLSAGLDQTCGIDDRDELWCWGRPIGPFDDLEWPSVQEPTRQLIEGRVHSVTIGKDHVCALDYDQQTWCWGNGDFGQLGNGSLDWREQPSPTAVEHRFHAVFAGEAISCGIDDGDEAFCWGLNDLGQLGVGNLVQEVAVPTPIDGGHKFRTLSLGYYHGCGVDVDGHAWCWGYSMRGEVGDPACGTIGACSSPVEIPGLTDLVDIAVGFGFSCALDAGGQVWCWGRNEYGELGTGLLGDSVEPLPVAGLHTFDELRAGPFYACGVEDGEVWCWGLLEFDDPVEHILPERIDAPQAGVRGLATGLAHQCGVGPTGVPVCWGYNGGGQLGVPDSNNHPRQVKLGEAVVSVSVGIQHSCAIDHSGRVWCWGWNDMGQLGHTPLDGWVYFHPAPRPVFTDVVLRSVVTGSNHSCAVDELDRIWCWGSNIKVGATGQYYGHTPTMAVSSVRLVSLTSNTIHTCGLDGDGRAYCWGNNLVGQLGDGTTTDSAAPIAVSGDHRFRQLSAGNATTCGIDLAGQAWCWGSNGLGQFGDGTLEPSTTPTPAAVGHVLEQITLASVWHTCALDTEGRAWCWGINAYGVVGNETVTIFPTPSAVAGDFRFQAIAAGVHHVCALDMDGQAYCWGLNSENSLGTELPLVASFAPLAVATNRRFTKIEAGLNGTCGVEPDGGLWCWGSDMGGKLGSFEQSTAAVEVSGSSVLEEAP